MANDRDANGHFSQGNKMSRGRPRGARNKSPAYPFTDENDLSAPARRFKALMLRICADLGGIETLSAGQRQLVRRCAMISVQCELMERDAIAGQPLNAIAYGTLTGHRTRTLNALGFKREPVDVTPVISAHCRPRLRISSQPRTRARADRPACVFCSTPRVRPAWAMHGEHLSRLLRVENGR
jgi:hypothetical protein